MTYRSKYKALEIEALLDKSNMMLPTRLSDYLYRAHYLTVNEALIKQHFLTKKIDSVPRCTVVKNGRFVGRNLDWLYSRQPDIIVHFDHDDNGFALMGTASEADRNWTILPGFLQDGVNEHGLFCNINVVPDDYGNTVKSIPLVSEKDEICTIMVPSYILRHFTNAPDAAGFMQDHLSMFSPKTLKDMHYESHFMVADLDNAYVVEIIDGRVEVTEHNMMTNFFIHGVTFNENGKVNTQASAVNPVQANGITPFGSGLERYNYIVDNYQSASTRQGMRNLMNGLLYTNAYKPETDPQWYSEFVGHYTNDITLETPVNDPYFQSVLATARGYYEEHDRDAKNFWQTTHSCVYDLERKKMWLVAQEDTSVEIPVCLKEYYTAGEIEELLNI